jgi:predicted PhzF superfamily epimerase YddE/YHI9
MPMAGHPTIGSTFALAALGVIPRERARWVFGLNIGPTPVGLEWGADGLTMAWMDQGAPAFRALVVSPTDVVEAIRADPASWEATGLPVEEVSCGNAFFHVPLATRAAVDACEPDGAAMHRLRSAGGRPIVSAQGVKMGRPSQLHVRVEAASRDAITRVHVGGAAVCVGEGSLTW